MITGLKKMYADICGEGNMIKTQQNWTVSAEVLAAITLCSIIRGSSGCCLHLSIDDSHYYPSYRFILHPEHQIKLTQKTQEPLCARTEPGKGFF